MAYQSVSTTVKVNCRQCAPKSATAVTSCRGCSQDFCRKHFNQHRDQLSDQLNAVINQHDTILQDLQPQATPRSTITRDKRANQLLQQIEQWKTNAIEQVMRVAKDATDTIESLFNREIQNQELRERMRVITKELTEQQESESFVETDIQRWTNRLEQIKLATQRPLPSEVQSPKIEIQSIAWQDIIIIHSASTHHNTSDYISTSTNRNSAQTSKPITKLCRHPFHRN